MSDFGKNRHVAKVLDEYIEASNTNFALLLNGKWGSGKTWFIKKYIESRVPKLTQITENGLKSPEFCYVSLFGLEKIEDVNYAIFKHFHPLLTSDVARGIGSMLGFIVDKLPAGLGLPIQSNDVKKVSEALKPFISQVEKEVILVMDDFERCRIPSYQILGYINNQLDTYKSKVIIIANVDEITKKNKSEFNKIKEKVIGSAVNITPNFFEVLENEILNIGKDRKIYKIFNDNLDEIKKIFSLSETHNLRHINKIIFEFSRLYEHIPENYKDDDELISYILKQNIIFSIETHERKKELDDMVSPESTSWPPRMRLRNKEENTLLKLYEKYDMNEFIFSPLFWHEFLVKGNIDIESLDEHLKAMIKNPLYPEFPPLRFWWFYGMEENIVNEGINQIKKDIIDEKYLDPAIFLHACGILIKASELNIIDNSIDFIVSIIKNTINRLKFNITKSVIINILSPSLSNFGESSYGKEYHAHDSTEFKDIYKLVSGKCRLIFVQQKETVFEEILLNLPYEFDDSLRKLKNMTTDFSGFFINGIDYKNFAKILLTMNNKQIREFSPIFILLVENHMMGTYNSVSDISNWVHNLKGVIPLLPEFKYIHPLKKITLNILIKQLPKKN